jgi:biopolymer transport protein ExbD
MELKSKNKVEVGFNMSSMTDVIFLLLIFFMLTANFVTPSGLPVNLPTSKSSTTVFQKVSVTISKDYRYFVNARETSKMRLESDLRRALEETKTSGEQKGVVVLHIDSEVSVDELVNVAGIATSMNAKVTIATKPER